MKPIEHVDYVDLPGGLCGGKFPTSTSPTLSDLCLRNPWMHVCSLQKHMLEHFGKPCLDAYIVCSPRRFVSSLLHSWSSHSQLASLASGDQQSIQQQSSRYSGCLASDSQIFSSCSDWEEPHVWSIMKSSLNWFYWTKQHETTWNKTSKNIKSTMQNDALRCSLSHFRYSEAMFIKKSSWSTWLGILSAKPGSAAVRHRHRRDDVTLDVIFVWFWIGSVWIHWDFEFDIFRILLILSGRKYGIDSFAHYRMKVRNPDTILKDRDGVAMWECGDIKWNRTMWGTVGNVFLIFMYSIIFLYYIL